MNDEHERQPELIGTKKATECWWSDGDISFEFTQGGMTVWLRGYECPMSASDVVEFSAWLAEMAKVVKP